MSDAVTHVSALWRYPVKSMQGEQLTEARIGPTGLDGDRTWAVVDTNTGLALTARRAPQLLFAQARLVDDNVRITLPDGSVAADDAALSAWLERPVALTRAGPETSGRFEIGLANDDDADRDPNVEWYQWDGPVGTFHDSTRTQVSIIGSATVGSWDMRRFRPNVVVEGTSEDQWVGSAVLVGEVTLEVVKRIDRCVMTTRAQPGGIDRDVDVLRTIIRDRANNLGIGALVRNPGTVRVGDAVEPDSSF
ncbi:MAG: MOSC N-terminal beta barrel domain-containing protein [Acidimicrobiia bacterium]